MGSVSKKSKIILMFFLSALFFNLFAATTSFAELEDLRVIRKDVTGTANDLVVFVQHSSAGSYRHWAFELDGSPLADYWMSIFLNITIESGAAKNFAVRFNSNADGSPAATPLYTDPSGRAFYPVMGVRFCNTAASGCTGASGNW